MEEGEFESIRLEPGEALIVIDQDLKARLVFRHEGSEDEPVSPAILWARALTLALNDEEDDLAQQIVGRLMGRIEQESEESDE